MYNWTQEVLTPEALLAEAREFHRRYGFTTFKLKAGALPPDEEIEALRLIRKHFGDAVKLRIDPNAGWSRETALRLIPALEDIGLEYYEDPVEGMDAMADVQRHTHIPTATNMCLVRFDQFAEGVKKEAVRVVLADHHAWGGLWAFQQCGTTCATFGLGTSQHSNTHLGISMAAMVHAGAVAPNVTYASDTHYPWQQGWDVINETFYFEGGCLAVPTGPGLGVTIAPDRLAALAEIAAQRPSLARDDLTLMSHFVPGWQPRRGKW
jgi:glucarate dehydratase